MVFEGLPTMSLTRYQTVAAAPVEVAMDVMIAHWMGPHRFTLIIIHLEAVQELVPTLFTQVHPDFVIIPDILLTILCR